MTDDKATTVKVQTAILAMPFLVWIVPCLVTTISPSVALLLFVAGVVLFPLLFAVVFSLSRWFRNNCILILPFWFVSHILLMSLFGFTQGAISAAVSKAFSAADSQITAVHKLEYADSDSAPSQLIKPAASERTSSGK